MVKGIKQYKKRELIIIKNNYYYNDNQIGTRGNPFRKGLHMLIPILVKRGSVWL